MIVCKSKIRVMLADDHDLFRKTMASALLNGCDHIAITGDAPNGLALLELMKANVPDIVLLDLEMPVLDGHKTIEIIREQFPSVKTIILSVHYNEYYIAQLILRGAAGYLSKSALHETIVTTIGKVYQEGFYFNEKISKEVIISLLDEGKLEYLTSRRILSDREIPIVKRICNGKSYKETAEELNISVDTVKFHIKSIYRKTQINSIAGLVKYAIRVGITSLN